MTIKDFAQKYDLTEEDFNSGSGFTVTVPIFSSKYRDYFLPNLPYGLIIIRTTREEVGKRLIHCPEETQEKFAVSLVQEGTEHPGGFFPLDGDLGDLKRRLHVMSALTDRGWLVVAN